MNEKTKKVLIKVAKEIGIELLKIVSSKISQVANELQKDDFQKKWGDKEKNPGYLFGKTTYDDFDKRLNERYEIKKVKNKDDNEV